MSQGFALFVIPLALVALAIIVYSLSNTPATTKDLPTISGNAVVIGLISDTHSHLSANQEVAEKVYEIFRKARVSLIIHAGDLGDLNVANGLGKVASVAAVCGNMDPLEVKAALPTARVVSVGNCKIGVVHRAGFPPLWWSNTARELVKKEDLNVLIFGHTHKPYIKFEGGVLFINPGSPTEPLPPLLVKRTVGLLEIAEEGVKPHIIEV